MRDRAGMAQNCVFFEALSRLPTFKGPTGATGERKSTSSSSNGAPSPHALSCAVAAPRSDCLVFGGKRSGEVVMWQLIASRSKGESDQARSTMQSKATVLGSHKGGVTCAAYYPARKLLFTASSDSSVCVWDPTQSYQKTNGTANGYRLQLIPAHDGTVTAIAVHCNIVVTGSVDKTVKIWMFDERREGLAIPFLVAKQAFVLDNWITTIFATLTKATEVQSEDIFVGDASGNVTTLHSVMAPMLQKNAVEDNGVLQVELVRHSRLSEPTSADSSPKTIVSIFPLPNINSIVTLSFESFALITDASKGTQLGRIDHPDSSLTASRGGNRFQDILFFPSREEMVLLDNNGTLFLWESRTNQFLCVRKSVGKAVARALVSYSSYGLGSQPSYLRSADDCFFVVYDDGIELMQIVRIKSVTEVKGHEGRIISVHVNALSEYAALAASSEPDGSSDSAGPSAADTLQDVAFVTTGADNKICMWSSRLSLVRSFTEKYSEISSFCFAPEIDLCATGHENGSVKFWGLNKDRSIRFVAHDNTVSYIGVGLHRYDKRHDRMNPWKHFFTTSFDGCLAVWDVPIESSKPKCEGRVRVSNSELLCAVYDPIKFCYIVGDNNGCISVWSVEDLAPLRSFQHTVRAPANSAQRSVVVVSTNRRPAHKEAVTSIALDGNIAVSGGEDTKIFLWNTVSGDCVKELNTDALVKELPSTNGPVFGEIQQLHVSAESGDVFVCTRSGLVVQFNQSTGVPMSCYKAQVEVSALCINPYGSEVIIGLDNGSVLRTPFSMFRPLTLVAEEAEVE